MRLTANQAQIIKDSVSRLDGPGSRVWLFGSRVQDELEKATSIFSSKRKRSYPTGKTLYKIEGALVMALVDRKEDILIKHARTPDVPVFQVARRTRVLL